MWLLFPYDLKQTWILGFQVENSRDMQSRSSTCPPHVLSNRVHVIHRLGWGWLQCERITLEIHSIWQNEKMVCSTLRFCSLINSYGLGPFFQLLEVWSLRYPLQPGVGGPIPWGCSSSRGVWQSEKTHIHMCVLKKKFWTMGCSPVIFLCQTPK